MRSLLVLLVLPAAARAGGDVDFDKTLAPLLAGRCLGCHAGAGAKGGLDLSTAKGVAAGGDNGPAVAPGKPAESLLWRRVAAGEMPPKHPLPEQERAVLKAWIEGGAKWGHGDIDPFRFTTDSRAGFDWWSLAPLARPTPPRADLHPIDAFVRAGLAGRKLTPSPPADRHTLLRRLSFDLIGLPPTSAEIDAFLKDTAPDAYEKVVDRLLASPHYGERWARHWLDVAHFAESDGFEFDKVRPHAWRYRDWVIRALNADVPYDRFAKLQIAGDILQPGDPDAVVATGFLVGGPHDALMPAGEAMRLVMRQDELEDIVGLVSQSFLGLTVHCARCHDHKFDPIRQADYYRLAAALAGVRRGDRPLTLAIPPELPARVESMRKELAAIEEPVRKRILEGRKAGPADPAPPKPYAAWDFSGGLRDTVGGLHGRAVGAAKIADGALRLDGASYVVAGPLPDAIVEKTFEAWVRLDDLGQRGGGVIGLQMLDGGVFDALVYGETEPGRWLAGSDSFKRTKPFGGPAEADAKAAFVHVAVTYAADGTVTGYRQGRLYGASYNPGRPPVFSPPAGAEVLFGLRHSPPGGNKHLTGAILRANLYTRALTADEVRRSAESAGFVSEADLVAALSPDQRDARRRTTAELMEAEAKLRELKEARAFAVTPQPPGPTHLLKRGDPQAKAEVIAPGGLGALPGGDFRLAADAPEAERRRTLAEWIASDRNPLFARTAVNRVWQYHFGRGLVETASDLGFNGGRPTHPELLDYLAAEFIARKWSLKALHRLIVTSETYRQSSGMRNAELGMRNEDRPAMALAGGLILIPNSELRNPHSVDADNRSLWRFSPRRLEAEAVRDATLAVAGQLNPAVGGKGYQDVRPFIHRTSQYYEPLDPVGPDFNRRSVYRMGARGGRNPLLEAFDCPDPSVTAPKRAATTTPLQALALLNGSFTLRMADHFADRLRKEAGVDVATQIRLGFLLAYGRPALDAEVAASRGVVEKHGLPAFCRALLNSNGFLYVH